MATPDEPKRLDGRVAVVAGATRGAGRGIARALGEAGATVYCTGRSVEGAPSPYGRLETIGETAAMVTAAGGEGVAVRVDHSIEAEVETLFERVRKERGSLDVLVNTIAGEDPRMGWWGPFWQADMTEAPDVLRNALFSHVVTAKHAANMMVARKRGLIVEVTEGDMLNAGVNAIAGFVKSGLSLLARSMADELRPHGVAAVAITPGFLRSETMLEHFGVDEESWREGGEKDPHFLESETPLFVGRAVAALASEPDVMDRTGMLTSSWELARDYGFTDADGRRPDWGRHFESIAMTIPMFRDGLPRQLEWLETITDRVRRCVEGHAGTPR